MDAIAEAIGEPICLAMYQVCLFSIKKCVGGARVPGEMSSAGDNMTITERFKNVLENIVGRKFFGMTDKETDSFRKRFGAHFKDWKASSFRISEFRFK
ncbi:unnamed protein product [Cylicostephanus goldi]|uniref:Uncharacterized protein n=1 Tax=Cylicostephanus goldi TaxID=71465 RepID=A0A3P7M7L6_CYLGO|nr:unnamed protein product [Cylicostephanus goldi]